MQIISKSPQQTIKIGQKLAKHLRPKDIIALFGNLGSGKTILVKGIAKGLKVDVKTVNSPTFVLIKEYKAKLPLFHFDLYRIKNSWQIYRLGYEEYFFNKGISVIEWAEKMEKLLPEAYLKIELFIKNKNKRLIKFTPHGERYKGLISKL